MSGKIPQEFIDELLQRVDIVDVIDHRVPLKKAGKDFTARCPFHDEKSPSFTVSQTKQFYHCFGCGANGNVISFLMEYDHMEFPEAIEELAGRVGMTMPARTDTSHTPRREHDVLLPLLERASRYFQTQLRQHAEARTAVDYLKRRGVDGGIAKRFEIGFAPDTWDGLIRAFAASERELSELERVGLVIRKEKGRYYDRFRGRVIFPIRDHRGRVVGFGGRVLGEGEPKYLNSPETPVFHKGSELYNLFGARGAIREADEAIVVEGYMDVVALAQHGVDNSVAALGTATTPQHLHRLFRLASHVVFCFDGDRAGRDAARKAMEISLPEMYGGRQVSFLFLPEGSDPDDFIRANGADEFRAAVAKAQPLDDFLFEQLRRRTRIDDDHRKDRKDVHAQLVELAGPMLASVPPGPFRDLLNKKLGEISGLDDADYMVHFEARGRRKNAKGSTHSPPVKTPPLSYYGHLLSLLLQHPKLIRILPDIEGLDDQESPAAMLLAQVISFLHEDDLTTTAAVVERFRHSPHHARLEKLASWNHQIVDGKLEETLLQTADSVRRSILDDAIDRLLEKSGQQPLSAAEKADLNRFMHQRQTLRMDASSFAGSG
jgi:DNA primase